MRGHPLWVAACRVSAVVGCVWGCIGQQRGTVGSTSTTKCSELKWLAAGVHDGLGMRSVEALMVRGNPSVELDALSLSPGCIPDVHGGI